MTSSIVIPSYNGKSFLEANLPAVVALKANEIIIVDDASKDGSADFIAQNYPQIKLIRHSTNQGFPRSVNAGFSQSTRDIVILLNQDVLPSRNLLEKTLPHFDRPKVFAVTFNENNRSWAKAFLLNGMLEHHNGKLDNHTHSSFWASGGGSAFRRAVWLELDGFDEVFSPGYVEDLDLGWRAWRAGYQILWAPDAQISHAKPESTFKNTYSPIFLQRLKDRNYLLMHWKNLDSSEFPLHLLAIVRRVLAGPGYLVPLFQSMTRLPQILTSRSKPAVTNSQIFPQIQ